MVSVSLTFVVWWLTIDIENFDEGIDSATCLSMYLALLASEIFFESEKRWPGANSLDNLAADKEKVQQILLDLFPIFNEGLPEVLEQSVEEVCVFGLGENEADTFPVFEVVSPPFPPLPLLSAVSWPKKPLSLSPTSTHLWITLWCST